MKCLYREKTEAAKTAPRCYSKPRVSCALIVPNTKHWPAWKDCSATGRVTEAGWGRLMTRPPGGVWLWDEIEKAHPELVQLFLQMADEGRVTLACGETLDLGTSTSSSQQSWLGGNHRATVTESRGFGSDPYSKEKLKAEMGAVFLCGQSGISETTLENSPSYIQNWLERLQNDKILIVQPAAQAQKAADFILGFIPEEAHGKES